MNFDYLIVGAGLSACTIAERIASQLNKKCLIVEQRNHIGGNCFDYKHECGVLVHKYGPHIFHTMNQKVWDYLSLFTEWQPYEHRVLAVIGDKKVPVPFNFNSIDLIFESKIADDYKNALLNKYGPGLKIPILKLRESNEKKLRDIADFIYEKIFYGYTFKQWGFKPEELDYTVTGRIPVLLSRDDRYFHDTYQAIPSLGYTELMKNMINHKNIELLLGTDYKDIINDIRFDKMIYTGAIDYFFDYVHGELPYRSLSFQTEIINFESDSRNPAIPLIRATAAISAYFQETAQVNFPNSEDYTRITEFKHFLPIEIPETIIAKEYPEQYKKGVNEPYYPIPKADNDLIYSKYKFEAQKLNKSVYFTGRLADYKYYNMDQTVGVALLTFEKQIASE